MRKAIKVLIISIIMLFLNTHIHNKVVAVPFENSNNNFSLVAIQTIAKKDGNKIPNKFEKIIVNKSGFYRTSTVANYLLMLILFNNHKFQ